MRLQSARRGTRLWARAQGGFQHQADVFGVGGAQDNPALLAALNQYVKEEKGGLFFNMMKKRYFKNKRTIAKAKDSLRVDLSGRLSPYDELVKNTPASTAKIGG